MSLKELNAWFNTILKLLNCLPTYLMLYTNLSPILVFQEGSSEPHSLHNSNMSPIFFIFTTVLYLIACNIRICNTAIKGSDRQCMVVKLRMYSIVK